MKITYDKDADALYIKFIDEDSQCRVVQLTKDIALDFAPGERLAGMEVLGAHQLFGEGGTPVIDLKDVKGRVVSG